MSLEAKVLYEFGEFRCDPGEALLLHAGAPVPIPPKSFDILLVLIRSNGRLRTKDELIQEVWPDSFVEESNLAVHISALRKVLGETAGGLQYIETVPKRGYRFVAPVTERRDEGRPGATADISYIEQRETSPRPALAPSSPAPLRHWWAAAAAFLLFAITLAVLISSRPTKLTDKDSVVLADFANTTGDPVFDHALRQGLSTQLEQSPFLNLLSDERIAQTVSLMALPRDSRLTQELAREVCLRTASAAVLDGSIAQVGTRYLLTLRATNCSNGDSLGSSEAQAADKNHVLDAMGRVASEIRNKLGESLASVEKYDAPAENVTTPSLEALQAYSLGYQAMVARSDHATAIPLFQRAINLDPNFAMAYARMGTSYSDLNESERAAESARRAYAVRARVSERERFYIDSHYEALVTGNLEAARKVYELWAQLYARDTPASGLIYSELGDYDKALVAYQQSLRLRPETGNRYANLVTGYLQLNRLDDVKASAREARAHNLDTPEIHLNLYWVDFLQRDAAGMQIEAAVLMGKPGSEDQMLNYESDTAWYGGQVAKSRLMSQRAVDSANRAEEGEAAAVYEAEAAVREALAGYPGLVNQRARRALSLSNGRDVEALSAVALGLAGDSAQAIRLADDLGKRFPQDTIVQFNYLPTIRAAVSLRDNDAVRAIEVLAVAAPHELGGIVEIFHFVLYPVYLRGEAFLAAKQGTAAAAEFRKILDHPGVVRSEPIGALAHLELGRAYALSGDTGKAKSAYTDFLTLWKDADPDIPILKQAKAEYSGLN